MNSKASDVSERVAFAEKVLGELRERVPTYLTRSLEREHVDRAILAISGLLRPTLSPPLPSLEVERLPVGELELKVAFNSIDAARQALRAANQWHTAGDLHDAGNILRAALSALPLDGGL